MFDGLSPGYTCHYTVNTKQQRLTQKRILAAILVNERQQTRSPIVTTSNDVSIQLHQLKFQHVQAEWLIISANGDHVFACVCVFVCYRDNSQSCGRIFMKICGGVGRMTSNSESVHDFSKLRTRKLLRRGR